MINFIVINIFLLVFSVIGLVFARHNFVLVLVSLEIGFLSLSIMYCLSSFFSDDISGQLFTAFILTIAGGESAIAISFLVFLDRYSFALNSDRVSFLKGLFFEKCIL
jgi:NADH-quinone oxidoreductase subunit K